MTLLPPSLVRFEGELEDAIRRDVDVHRRRRARRRIVSVAAVLAAAAAVAIGVLTAMPGTGRSAVARAAAAAAGPTGSVVHVVANGRDVNTAGAASTWRLETWQETSAPFAHRSVRTANGVTAEEVTVDGVTRLYDPAANTIYTTPPFTTSSKPTPPPGRAGKAPGVPMKPGSDASKANPAKGASPVKTGSQPPGEDADPIRAKILGILGSGAASEEGHATVEGKDALKLVSNDGTATIFVDPQSYRPIFWTTSAPDGSTSTVHFDTYETLPGTAATDALLSLSAQHPDARVDDSPADYAAAAARLFGKR
jgi:hypothetical protein